MAGKRLIGLSLADIQRENRDAPLNVACRPGIARREGLLSGALMLLKFVSAVLGTVRIQPFPPHHYVSRYRAVHATMASGRVRLATDGGAKTAR